MTESPEPPEPQETPKSPEPTASSDSRESSASRESRESPETAVLLERAGRGDQEAIGSLLERHRDRLRRMVRLRLDRRLQGRLDASDVIQEAYIDACRRLPEYLRDPAIPFFLWLRFLTGQRLLALHEHHLGAKARDPRREVSLH